MKFLYYLFLTTTLAACSGTIKLYDLDEADCSRLVYGQITTRRMLTDVDKNQLAKNGLLVQDFIFENVYSGVWKQNWSGKDLDRTPIRNLNALTPDQKLAGGILLSEIEKTENRNVTLLIQTIGPMVPESLNSYGRIISEKNSFIRMETGIRNVSDLSNHPCIKTISILEPENTPDSNKE
jgi:hypothetical protein